jgi:hypothetical protein
MYATVNKNHCEEGSFQAELQTMWDVHFDHDENHISNSFRKSNEKIQQELQSIDITKLKPHDPYFLLIPWPKENGPEARAYANHYNWKRGLSDSERLRWQKWAMYQITHNHESNAFDYQVEDYIKQQLWKALEAKAVRLIMSGDVTTGQATAAALEGFHQLEAEAITRAMKAYYKSFNFKNVEDLLNFWLPNDHCELNVPGFDRARGIRSVENTYRQLFDRVRPLCTIEPYFLGTQSFGNTAIVFTLERRRKGFDRVLLEKPKSSSRPSSMVNEESTIKTSKEKTSSTSKSHILSMTVLRYANKMWRIVSHHTTKVATAPFLGNEVKVSALASHKLPTADASSLNSVSSSASSSASASSSSSSSSSSSFSAGSKQTSFPFKESSKLAAVENALRSMVSDRRQHLHKDKNSPRSEHESFEIEDIQIIDDNDEDDVDDEDDSEEEVKEGVDSGKVQLPAPGHQPLSRLVLETIRELANEDLISSRDKDILLDHVIEAIVQKQKSFVEVAFEIIFGVDLSEDEEEMDDDLDDAPLNYRLRSHNHSESRPLVERRKMSSDALRNFAQQCQVAVKQLLQQYPALHGRYV